MNETSRNIPSVGPRKLLTYLGIIFLVNISFLFSPGPDLNHPSSDICLQSYIQINRYMGFPVNCDAISFISPAIKPSVLLQQGYIRQSRPAYILLGTLVGYTIYYGSSPLHPWLYRHLYGHLAAADSTKEPKTLVLYACFYLAFLLINTGILLLSLLLFEKIIYAFYECKPPGSSILPLMFVLLLSTPLCKAFFWTVHQQLFNILMPILALYLGQQLIRRQRKFTTYLLLSFLSGLGILFYANAVLLLPTLCFCHLKAIRLRGLYPSAKEWLKLVGMAVVFFSGAIGWIAFLRLKGVSIYNHEITAAREFVWIADIFHNPGFFWKELPHNLMAFLQTFSVCAFPMLILLLVLAYKRKEMPGALRTIRSSTLLPSKVTVITFVIGIFLLFYGLMGYYAIRLTAVLNPFLIYATSLLLVRHQPKRKLTFLLLLAVIGFHLYLMFSYGPFS